nr:hypothetical protein [Tanacetum cinerariifolium]
MNRSIWELTFPVRVSHAQCAALSDDVFPAEEQPLPAAASPTDESPGYILESDPDEDLEEDDDKDLKKDP